MSTDFADFIRANTAIASAPLCPEIKLYLATEITPLWEATEAYLAKNAIPPPYWAFCWAGGQALTRYLLDHEELVAGRRVLDFAAGCGISAIAAALRGAASSEANEIDPVAARVIALNAELNAAAVRPLIEDLTRHAANRWDLVVAGDVCYERPMADVIFPWLRELARQGATVLMADPGRAYLPRTGLMEMARYDVPTSLELEDKTHRMTVIYKIVG
jgi:predicted nicotinamide N-methyase